MNNAKPLAKSLHTITALLNVAWAIFPARHDDTADLAVSEAARILGVADKPDDYGLRAKAAAAYIARLNTETAQ